MRMGTVGLWVPNRGDAELDGLTASPSVVILLRLQTHTEKRQRVDEACAYPPSSSLSPTHVARLCRCAPMSPCGRTGLQHPPTLLWLVVPVPAFSLQIPKQGQDMQKRLV